MALRAGTRLLPTIARPRTAIGWGGALAAGLAVISWRSVGGHVGSCGDIRTRYWNARFSSPFCRPFSLLPAAKHTMTLTPPQSPPGWEHTAEDILKFTKEAIEYDRAVQDKVGGLDPKDCTFESVSSCDVV